MRRLPLHVFTTSWFITLYAAALSADAVFPVWDAMLLSAAAQAREHAARGNVTIAGEPVGGATEGSHHAVNRIVSPPTSACLPSSSILSLLLARPKR